MKRFYTLLAIFLVAFSAWSQETDKQIIQFTGVVFAPDSSSVIPGVHVYVPAAGRGTTTNPYGFFSLPVMEGDSVVFSAVGYEKSHYIVPAHDQQQSLKVLITLKEDINFLKEVEIFPYPTEEMFKEAVLSLELPNQDPWLQQQYINRAYQQLANSQNANHEYYMQMQMQAIQNKYQTPSNNLLNPFAWAKFINSLKKD